MRPRSAPLALSLIVVVAVARAAVAAESPNFNVEPPGERILALRSGETGMDAVLALSSARGLVVIDTGIPPTPLKEHRAGLEEVLGRKDFIYDINRHFHYGHADGNQVFSEATVIGSEGTRQRIIEWNTTRDAFVAIRRNRLAAWTQQAAQAQAGSEQERRLRDLVANYTPATEDVAGEDFIFVPPTITLLLSHTPWQAEQASVAGVGLMLCGHTHGGQVWAFSYLVADRYPLPQGRHEVDGMTVIISRGTGARGPRMRLWRPGEIVRVTLRAASAQQPRETASAIAPRIPVPLWPERGHPWHRGEVSLAASVSTGTGSDTSCPTRTAVSAAAGAGGRSRWDEGPP